MERLPMRLRLGPQGLVAEWLDLGGTDPALPFLSDREAAALALGRQALSGPLPPAPRGAAAQPAGFVFHGGRCGSTLVARSLAGLRACRVIAEPQALNDALATAPGAALLAPADRAEAARRVIAALVAAGPAGQATICKCSSWAALHLELLEALHPESRCVFLYRQPEEVLASLAAAPAAWQRRAADPLQAALFLGTARPAAALRPLDFAARVLAGVMTAVADAVARDRAGRWLLVPYPALPEAITVRIAPHFGFEPSPEERQRLTALAGLDAKHVGPDPPFAPDGRRQQRAITPEIAALSGQWLRAPYERLEAARRRQDAARA